MSYCYWHNRVLWGGVDVCFVGKYKSDGVVGSVMSERGKNDTV